MIKYTVIGSEGGDGAILDHQFAGQVIIELKLEEEKDEDLNEELCRQWERRMEEL